jgi:hypothetical protein
MQKTSRFSFGMNPAARSELVKIRVTTILARELHRWGIQIVADLGSHIRVTLVPLPNRRSKIPNQK